MLDHHDLIQQAAEGSSAAHLGLVDLAIAAGASGICRQIESLAAAETWARLAAASGGKDENRALVGVLLARAEFEIGRCAVYNAQWYEGEARRALKLLVTLDDADAAEALRELGVPPADEHDPPDVAVFTNMAAAARGDVVALGLMCDEALRLLLDGQSDPIEALTAGELYARLGSASGGADQVRRLAGVLLKRAEFEYSEGSSALADHVLAEAAVLLSILVDTGDDSVGEWLSMLANDVSLSAIAIAAGHHPSILKFVDPKGAC